MPAAEPLPDLSTLSLADIARLAGERKLPPVDSWNPAHCGHSDMRIARDGTWYHQGVPIRRPAMVRLFSTILRREADGRHVLVTPAEKLDIDVEDRPFLAVEVKSEGEGERRRLAFRLNSDDVLVAGPDHSIRVGERDGEPHPTLAVRNGLEALIGRAVFYELASLAIEEGADPPGLWSDGCFFVLGPKA